ncbi:MAG: DUF2612 domain-containing protein [Pseudomonas sp.]|nr:DUF2612 domain-containing protein [Pseudomonas sp.]
MSTVQEFDASVNLLSAILWQYEDAEKLKALATAKQAWTTKHQTEFWLGWYRDVFNVDTANAFGLSIWGRILDVPLGLEVEKQNKVSFGFGSFNANFNNGNFGVDSDRTQGLTLEQQRLVIRLRYFQLTSRGTVPEINQFLNKLFGQDGGAFVIDPHDMSFAIYQFNFQPDSSLTFILDEFDLLPRPAGVGVEWRVIMRPVFGFGPYNLNFDNGTFGS